MHKLVYLIVALLTPFPVFGATDMAPENHDNSYSSRKKENGHYDQVKIGVLAFRGIENTLRIWTPTANYLSAEIPGTQFEILPLTLDNIGTALANGALDFVLTNPGNYAELEYRYGLSRIATLMNRRYNGAFTQYGAVIFTRADRKDIQSLKDLKNKRFMAVHPDAFGGWWMAWQELENAGINPAKDLKQLAFSGFPQRLIIQAVEDGKVDAGTVRTSLLEQLAANGEIQIDHFKVLNMRSTPGFPYMHSTQLYPEWPFAATNLTSKELAHRVINALLNMPPSDPAAKAAGIFGWTIPLDYLPVNELMQSLGVGHYKNLKKDQPFLVVSSWWVWVAISIFIFIFLTGIIFYVIVLNTRLKKSSQNLEFEISERKQAQMYSLEQARRLSALYEISSLSKLSFDEQLDEVLKVGCSIFNTEIGRICQVKVDENTNTTIAIHSPTNFNVQRGHQVPLDKTFCFIPYSNNKPLAIHNVANSKFANEICYQFSGFETYIAIPIFVNREKFGTINFCSFNPRPLPFEDSDIEFLKLVGKWVGVTIERHISAQLEKEKVIAQASNHAKSEFLAKVSHELRTPLNAIIGYSEILLEDFGPEQHAQVNDDLVKINDSANYLLSLINDLLDVSKIEAGKLDLYYETINIPELIDGISSTIKPFAHKNGNTLKILYNPKIGNMTGDYLRIRQTLINILSNATKFTRDGMINFSAEQENNNIVFTISDTGIGISPEKINKLFQDFAQADNAINREYGGTGLGLSISQRLCKLMHGSITVNSTLGKGSTFRIKIPIQPNSNKDPNEEPAPHYQIAGK